MTLACVNFTCNALYILIWRSLRFVFYIHIAMGIKKIVCVALMLSIVIATGFFLNRNYTKINSGEGYIKHNELEKIEDINVRVRRAKVSSYIELEDSAERVFLIDAVALSALKSNQFPTKPIIADVFTTKEGLAAYNSNGYDAIPVIDIVVEGQSYIDINRINDIYAKGLDSNYFIITLIGVVVLFLAFWQYKKQ